MNIINFLRKPYLAMFLASLMLFASCSQYDNEIVETSEPLSLSNFIGQHLQIVTEISILLESESNIDAESLQSISKNLKPEEMLGVLEDANFQQADVISELFLEMYNNNLNFTNSNPNLKNLNNNEIENMVTVEIDKQLIQFQRNKSSNVQSNKSDCKENMDRGASRCQRNFAISAASAIGVGLFTGGIGYAIGIATAGIIAGLCIDDVNQDYLECRLNNS